MDNKLSFLYNQIRRQQISPEEAVKQIKRFKAETEFCHSFPGIGHEYSILTETNGHSAFPQKNLTDTDGLGVSPETDEIRSMAEIYSYDEPYLRDHTVFGERMLIGVTYASLAINIFFKMLPHEKSVHLHRLSFVRPVGLKKGQSAEVVVRPVVTGTGIDFRVMYRYDTSSVWNLTASGKMQTTSFTIGEINLARINASLEEYTDMNRIYTGNPAIGLGDSFRTIIHLYAGKELALARVVLHQGSGEERHQYILHPLILNSAFLAVGPLVELNGKGQLNGKESYLPFGIKDISFRKTGVLEKCWLLVRLSKNSGEMIVFDADVINENSQVVANLGGCSLKRFRHAGQGFAGDKLIVGAGELTPPGPADRLNPADLNGKIQKYLEEKLSKIIPVPSRPAKPEVNIMDMGAESAQLVALTSEIEKETGIELYPTLFFEYPNVQELTEYFSTEHSDSFNRLLADSFRQKGISDPGIPQLPITGTNAADTTDTDTTDTDTTDTGTTDTGTTDRIADDKTVTQMRTTDSVTGDIAVIGIHGMFAESADLDEFWNNLCTKKDFIKEIPIDHWDYRPWYDPDPDSEAEDKTYCKWGSFINDVDRFDATFFNISRREAEWMDPQLRLLLQSIYAAGEDAGYMSRLRGTNTGVFVGVCFHDYAGKIAELNLPVDPHVGTGNTHTVIANRISFYFDFTGPSVAVDTACSSSLFALHQACQAMRSKECNMAFVGGVNLLLSSWHYRYFSSIGALSPTGRCHTFDEAADGYVPGECIASILLKPLPEAEKDGDHIYAVIKGSAALHGGYTPSLTAPSIAGEANVILKAWENAGLDPETLTYIEAHGTGTKLGDPIEINSLKKAFEKFTAKEHFCTVGSVKASIGHAEGAAGIAGVLKVILQMKHRKIPPMPLFNKLNPYIKLERSPLYINREVADWGGPPGVPRRAGVSSFGFSGAYAHVVIEEYVPEGVGIPQMTGASQNPEIVILSAKNEERLKERVRQLLDIVKEEKISDSSLSDLAYTLQAGREAMEERLAVVVKSVKELEDKLKGFLEGRDGIKDLYRNHIKRNSEILDAFAEDEELREAVDKWIQRARYSRLLYFWVRGLSIDWNKLYGDIKPGRISLPTYPFAGERYWIMETGDKSMDQNALESLKSQLVFSNSSQQQILMDTVSSETLKKPSRISLQNLAGSKTLSRKSIEQIYDLTSINDLSLSSNDNSISDVDVKINVSVESLQEELALSLAEALFMNRDNVGIDKNFIDMGLDSVIGIEWIRNLNKQYNTEIPATKVYDYPTIRNLAEFLVKQLNKPVEESKQKSKQKSKYESKQESLEKTSTMPLQEVLKLVYQGNLDLGEAYKVLEPCILKEK